MFEVVVISVTKHEQWQGWNTDRLQFKAWITVQLLHYCFIQHYITQCSAVIYICTIQIWPYTLFLHHFLWCFLASFVWNCSPQQHSNIVQFLFICNWEGNIKLNWISWCAWLWTNWPLPAYLSLIVNNACIELCLSVCLSVGFSTHFSSVRN